MQENISKLMELSIRGLIEPCTNPCDSFSGMSLASNTKRLRESRKWSQDDLAKLVGVSQPTINNIESGRYKTTKHIFKLAQVFNVDIAELDPSIGIPPSITAEPAIPEGTAFGLVRDFPIYSAAEGGAGAIIISWEPVEYMVRPAPLLNVRGGYGIYVVGDSMVPAYEPGDIALVNPNLPPASMRDAVFFRADKANATEGLLKRLVKVSATDWWVEQHNPSKSFALSRAEWPQCQSVIGKYNR